MAAATGVGAKKIGDLYNEEIWKVTSTNPVSGDITFNMELEAITTGDPAHKYNISTWDKDSADNGLSVYVKDKSEEATMMVYLTNAYNNLEQLKQSPPLGMSETDLTEMQNGILKWAYYGLDNDFLGMPTP